MSSEYDLCCKRCKKHIWIASDGLSGRTFFYGESEIMKKLRDFLFEHDGHELVFEIDHLHEDDSEQV